MEDQPTQVSLCGFESPALESPTPRLKHYGNPGQPPSPTVSPLALGRPFLGLATELPLSQPWAKPCWKGRGESQGPEIGIT